MARKFSNQKQLNFLANIPDTSIESSNIGTKCNFNFSYFSPECGGQTLDDWNNANGSSSLKNILEKLKFFSSEPLSYWRNQRVGAGSLKMLEFYGQFPKQSNFKFPRCVPHDVMWGRFRLGNKVRLAGFSIPPAVAKKISETQGIALSDNTFYVVFLDSNHEFYPLEED